MNDLIYNLIIGMIVFVITWPINNYFTKITSNSEYYKRVKKAKDNVIETLTDYIISFKTIDTEIINEITLAEALDNNVKQSDLYNNREIKAILIRDFIGVKIMPDEQRKEILNIIENKISSGSNVSAAGIAGLVQGSACINPSIPSMLIPNRINTITSILSIIITLASLLVTISVNNEVQYKILLITMLIVTVIITEFIIIILITKKRKKLEEQNYKAIREKKN